MTENTAIKFGEKDRKSILIPTYLVAVACLLAGLLVPLFRTDAEFFSDRMMIKYIPQMINRLLSFTGKAVIPNSNFFIPSVEFEDKFSISLIATFCSATVILYSLTCVVSIIMILPICLSDSDKRTGHRCALSVEIIALLLVITHIAFNYYWMVSFGISEGVDVHLTDLNMVIPFLGTLFAISFQSISKNGYIGVSKTIGVFLSLLTAITFFSFSLFIPGIDKAMSNLSTLLGAGKKAGFITGMDAFTTGYGIDGISVMYGLNGEKVASGQTMQVIIYILTVVLTFAVTANVVIDVIDSGIGRKVKTVKDKAYLCRNGLSNNFAIARYCITFVLAAALFVFCFVAEGVMPGVYLYFLLVFLILQLINAIIRTAADNRRFKKALESGVIDQAGVILEEDGNTEGIDDSSVLIDKIEGEQGEVVYIQEEMDLPEEYYKTEDEITAPLPEEDSPFVQESLFEVENGAEDTPNEQPEAEFDNFYMEEADAQSEQEPETYPDEEPEFIELEPEYTDETEPETEYAPENEFNPENEPERVYNYTPAPIAEEVVEPVIVDTVEPVDEDITEPVKVDKVAPEPVYVKPAEPYYHPRSAYAPETAAKTPITQAYMPVNAVQSDVRTGEDSFIDSLSEDEKNEFVNVFIDKNKGAVNGVPDYKIGGDNSEFFASVFKHIVKYRKICSDKLLSKIYRQLR